MDKDGQKSQSISLSEQCHVVHRKELSQERIRVKVFCTNNRQTKILCMYL